jgi:hypothetical protein
MHGKTREFLGMSRTLRYVGMTKNEAQHSRWTFYEVIKVTQALFRSTFETPPDIFHWFF